MNDINFEDDDLSKYDVDDVDIDEEDIPKQKPKGSGNKPGPNGKPVGPKGKITKKQDKQIDPKILYGSIAVGVLVVGLLGFFVINNMNAKKQAQAEAQKLAEEQALLAQQNNSSGDVSVGIPNLYGTGSQTNQSNLTSSDNILKDLNGNTISPNYNVTLSETVTDFITYTKYRATTGDGIEFYWLDAVYKNQPCKVQVPYSIYSKLDDQGITVVDAEVLTLDNGSQVVTYMSVRKDAKDLLDKNR